MKIVIVAGSDRTGKSTLTEEFVRKGYEYKHFGPPTGSPYGEYIGYAKWLEEKGDPDGKYVIDRFMYCEFAYSKHYGRATDMTLDRMNEIEDILLGLDPNACVVYCETDLESNWRRIEDEGKHEFSDIEQLETLRMEYKRVLLHSKLDLVEYDFTKDGGRLGSIVAEIDAR